MAKKETQKVIQCSPVFFFIKQQLQIIQFMAVQGLAIKQKKKEKILKYLELLQSLKSCNDLIEDHRKSMYHMTRESSQQQNEESKQKTNTI